jgi:predicted ArsR family transcriptional regulator
MTARPSRVHGGQVNSAPRRRLLQLLRDSPAALDGYELGEATGLHVTTVRFHLEQLLTAGLIVAATQPRSTPGRPRTVYTAIPLPDTGKDGYQPLAALLAAHLGGSTQVRRRRAEKAGRQWAASLIPPTTSAVDQADATRQVTAMMTAMNFQPELIEPVGKTQDIRLRGCPYRDVARQQADVVCAIHLGLLRGAFTQLGGPPTEVTLTPFVEPDLCAIHLTVATPPTSATEVG